MRLDLLCRAALTVAAIALAAIALRPYVAPAPALAQAPDPSALYIEPGVYTIRAPDGSAEVFGKIVVDLHSGNVWGFPTGSKMPYPVTLRAEPPTSRPVYLGRFDLAGMHRKPPAQ
jgi:hypothetical protein